MPRCSQLSERPENEKSRRLPRCQANKRPITWVGVGVPGGLCVAGGVVQIWDVIGGRLCVVVVLRRAQHQWRFVCQARRCQGHLQHEGK